jgi:hypothetical protein
LPTEKRFETAHSDTEILLSGFFAGIINHLADDHAVACEAGPGTHIQSPIYLAQYTVFSVPATHCN